MISKKVKWYLLFESINELNEKFADRTTFIHKFMFGEILLVKKREEIIAFTSTCPHQNKPLDDCKVVDDHIVCPFHQYAFSCLDGKGMGMYLEKYELDLRNDGVYIGIERWSLF